MNYFKLLLNVIKLRGRCHWTSQKIKAYQMKAFRQLVVYAYEHSSYYKEVFEAKGINRNNIEKMPLSAFPTLDKSTLIEHFDQVVTVDDLTQEDLRLFDASHDTSQKTFKDQYHLVHSSGSTGKPAYFLYDDSAWQTMLAGIIRGAFWGMSTPQMVAFLRRKPRVLFIAATDGRYGGAMSVGDGIEGMKADQLFIDINSPIESWHTKLKAFKPTLMIGYPSALKIVAELVENNDMDLEVERLIACGEHLGSHLSSYLSETFKAPVIDIYGTSESLPMGISEAPEAGMILFDDLNIIETSREGIYLTSLYNYAQPLIRYKISDALELSSHENAKYPFTVAKQFLGRREDVLWFENQEGKKEFLHPLAIEGICIEGLKDYQFKQTGLQALSMYIEKTESISDDLLKTQVRKKVSALLREKQLDYVEVAIQVVKEILPDPYTGKKKLIISR